MAAPDLVGRDFTAEALNHTWFGDGIEIDTDEGKLYLTAFRLGPAVAQWAH